jgi:oxaloacetate decarboxylase alpha subunit
MVEASDVAEVVIEEGDNRVVVRKSGAVAAPVAAAPAASSVAVAPAEAPAPAPAAGARPAEWKTVIAPMVGTFYEAASPGSPPFVKVGDEVAEGQPLCIVEAMKLMNEINAEEPGIIREIGVANADAVEYGTVLFYYEPL